MTAPVPSWKRTIMPAAAMIAMVLVSGCATAPKAPVAAEKGAPAVRIEERSGVEAVSIRRTAAGRMLDFRFRVVDPMKASPVLSRRTPAYLVHEATGAKMEILESRMGRMRQNTIKPEKGRTYFMLFNTAGREVSPGDRVTLVIGEHRFENLTVQ
jgi:hypothetical protein